MLDIDKYDKALIISSDSDFSCLIKHLLSQNKFLGLMSTSSKKCSAILKKYAGENFFTLFSVKNKLEYKEVAQHENEISSNTTYDKFTLIEDSS